MFDNSKKKKAIIAFKRQREKLEDESYHKDVMWVAQTTDLIKKYIGEDSSFHAVAQHFTFSVMAMYSHNDIINEINSRKEQAFKLVENCIEFIENHGIISEPKINFLQKIDNATIYSALGGIVTIVASGAYFIGSFVTKVNLEREFDKKEAQIESLNQQIKTYQAIFEKINPNGHDSTNRKTN